MDHLRIISESHWNWMLFQCNDNYILSVVCGSAAIYTCDIFLSVAETSKYLQHGESTINELVKHIRDNSKAYQNRHIQYFSNSEAVKAAIKKWKEDPNYHQTKD